MENISLLKNILIYHDVSCSFSSGTSVIRDALFPSKGLLRLLVSIINLLMKEKPEGSLLQVDSSK
jgi:hypothetical protein